MIEMHILYAIIGFLLASYAVIANDSVQTLGTFIASNSKSFKWYWLWLAASSVLIFTMTYGWIINDGDISYGRLDRFPEVQVEWYHALAPAILLFLTWFGIPVSTTFLVLSAFAGTALVMDMLGKSIMGYGLAAISAFFIWMLVSKLIDEKYGKVKTEHKKAWRTAQWCATGFLWFTWLSHDMANIAIFLPREVPLELMILSTATLCGWLGYIFYSKGGKIQQIVLEKTGSKYVRSATIIDLVYALLLLFFKEVNNIPISTTWVFVGVLCGRELAISAMRTDYKIKHVFPLIGRDFLKMVVGLLVSIGIVVGVHYLEYEN
jgi:phosphate/sulfate permease